MHLTPFLFVFKHSDKFSCNFTDVQTLGMIMTIDTSWHDGYSVGHATIDKQHKKLLSLVGEADACFSGADPDCDERFHLILNELSNYARSHFDYEESLLRHLGYPKLAEQFDQHDMYMTKLSALMQSSSGGKADKAGLREFLSQWWLHHILEEDMQYKSHVAEA